MPQIIYFIILFINKSIICFIALIQIVIFKGLKHTWFTTQHMQQQHTSENVSSCTDVHIYHRLLTLSSLTGLINCLGVEGKISGPQPKLSLLRAEATSRGVWWLQSNRDAGKSGLTVDICSLPSSSHCCFRVEEV